MHKKGVSIHEDRTRKDVEDREGVGRMMIAGIVIYAIIAGGFTIYGLTVPPEGHFICSVVMGMLWPCILVASIFFMNGNKR